MQIILLFVVLAATVLLITGAVFLGSLVLGGLLLRTKRARVLVPVFLLIVPATVLSSLAGGAIVGYFAIRANENLIVLGPVGGLVAGAVAGVLFGSVGSIFWWRRMLGQATVSREVSRRQATA